MSNCIFSCEGVKCSSDNVESFKNIICQSHLKEVFGLKIFGFKSETKTSTDTCGPFLTPDNHYEFEPNTVVVPTRNFLDGYLLPEKAATYGFKYKLNPRLANYYNNLTMKRMKFSDIRIYRYHFELIRNLFETDPQKIDIINNLERAQVELKKHLQNRISHMNYWIRNESYYSNFDKMSVDETTDGGTCLLSEFSPFVGFLLYDMIFDKTFLAPLESKTPCMLYANVGYVKGVGLVAVNQVVNNVPLVVMGDNKGTVGYVQHKTHSEPKQVVANRTDASNYPDAMRSLNVISSNDRYCSPRVVY